MGPTAEMDRTQKRINKLKDRAVELSISNRGKKD